MRTKGWIKLHRKIQEHWLYQESRTFSKYEAWLDLIMMANFKDSKVLIDGKLIDVKKGQLITSVRKLCNHWNWSNTKVIRFLDLLEADGMITKKSDTKKTVITIVNYSFYHEEELEKRHRNDSEEIKNDKKNDAQTTVKTINNTEFSSSNEFEKRHRNDTETHREESKEYIEEKEEEKDAAIFFDTHVAMISPIIVEQIEKWEEVFPTEVIIRAMKEAVYQNIRNWKYINNTLVNWQNKGVKTLNDAEKVMNEFSKNKKIAQFKPRPTIEYNPEIDAF